MLIVTTGCADNGAPNPPAVAIDAGATAADADIADICTRRDSSVTVGSRLFHKDVEVLAATGTFAGQVVGKADDGVWNLDSCACGAECLIPDPWTIEIDAPDGWLPDDLPACVRIVQDRTCELFDGCDTDEQRSFRSLAISDITGPTPDLHYIVAKGHLYDAVTEATGVSMATQTAATTDCQGCSMGTLYDLVFSFADNTLVLAEEQEGTLGPYAVRNFQSFHDGLCDAPAVIRWALRKLTL